MFTMRKFYFYICLVAAFCLPLGSSTNSAAATLNFNLATQLIRTETSQLDDVDGHTVYFEVENLAFENGEVATIRDIAPAAHIRGSGSFIQTAMILFKDNSTITVKRNGVVKFAAPNSTAIGNWTSEIIKGTGRFEGIKGTESSKAEFILVEQGEVIRKGTGEGTMVYTLPVK
jgi:hypothetical protein